MRKRDISVRNTLRVIIMVTTGTALVLASAGFIGLDLYRFRSALQADLTTLADVVGSNSAASLLFRDAQSAGHTLEALTARPSITGARLYDAEGKPFVTWRARGSTVWIPARSTAPYVRSREGTVEVLRTIVIRGECVGFLYLASDQRDLVAHIRRYAIVGFGILLASVLVAFVVSSFLERMLTEPIVRLAGVADRVRQEKDYSLRTSPDLQSPRELTALTSAFNDMLAEIDLRDQRLRRHREELQEQVEERTRELREIAEANERLSQHRQAILDSASEGIVGLDALGVASFVNASAARILGHDAAALVGRPLHDIVHPSDLRRESADECDVCAVAGESHVRAGRTAVFVSSDRRTFPVEYTSSSMRGALRGAVVTFRDITERLAVERMKSEFVSTVSHELRTPLTSIRGALGLLHSGLLGQLNERGSRMLAIALENTDRLSRLINDLLDIERIASGKITLHRKVTEAAELMRAATGVVQAIADKASIEIDVEESRELLWVDGDRIVQTLTNLLANAIKFSPAGARVQLSGCRAPEGKFFAFTVRDSGRGIPSEKVDLVFERFVQVDASDSRDKGGSGLGLAICRSLVSAHGGSIWVDTKLGEGSAFHFTVPLAVLTSAATDALPEERASKFEEVADATYSAGC
jgi:PAS domain S-box-containing protein